MMTGKYCPNCKKVMQYTYHNFAHIGGYKCENCGHERKNPDYAVTEIDLKTGEIKINDKYKLKIGLRSIYSAYNVKETSYTFSSDKLDNKYRIALVSDSHLGTTFDADGFNR